MTYIHAFQIKNPSVIISLIFMSYMYLAGVKVGPKPALHPDRSRGHPFDTLNPVVMCRHWEERSISSTTARAQGLNWIDDHEDVRDTNQGRQRQMQPLSANGCITRTGRALEVQQLYLRLLRARTPYLPKARLPTQNPNPNRPAAT